MIAKKQKTKKNWLEPFILSLIFVLILVVVGYLVFSNLKLNSRRSELNSQLKQLQQQLNNMETKKNQLQTDISQVNQEEYLEQEARETLNMKKPGEEVVAIVPALNSEVQESAPNIIQKVISKLKFW
jgi:cell division protein FtsL